MEELLFAGKQPPTADTRFINRSNQSTRIAAFLLKHVPLRSHDIEEMIEFMDYVQNAFYSASLWDHDNSYSTLTATANALLDFQTPHGLRLRISSLSAPSFATSYTLSNRGFVDGSISFLYSSLPMRIPSQSSIIDLRNLVRGYRHLPELRRPDETYLWEIWQAGRRIDKKDTLLYGRLYLPTSTLEALYLRRISPSRLLRLSCVSDSALPNGGSILAQLQNDHAKYSTEYLFSTDSCLMGVRGLYNFGLDPRTIPRTTTPRGNVIPTDPQFGRLSAGAELYFSPLNKSGGVSTAIRFTTLPSHTGFPYTMALTLNPLMGNISSSYAVKAGSDVALSSRFDFNIYSYESDVQLGLELWRRKPLESGDTLPVEDTEPPALQESVLENKLTKDLLQQNNFQEVDSVFKARVNQHGKIGVLWEGRIKDLLVSIGADLNLKRRDNIIGSVGLEVSYSS